MKNRAKCKLCLSIIESFHSTDYVTCKCGEIVVDGGPALRCAANNWDNFIRVDENGNEVLIKVKELNTYDIDSIKPIPEKINPLDKKKELVEMLDEMIKNIENMPSHAMNNPINHYDFCSALLLMSSILKCD